MNKKWILTLLAGTFFSINGHAAFHQAPPYTLQLKNPIAAGDKAAIQKGAELFTSQCASCHGSDAMGTANIPSLATGPVQIAPDGQVFWYLGKGSPEKGMPATTLPEKQIWQLVTFIKSLDNAPYTPPTPPAAGG